VLVSVHRNTSWVLTHFPCRQSQQGGSESWVQNASGQLPVPVDLVCSTGITHRAREGVLSKEMRARTKYPNGRERPAVGMTAGPCSGDDRRVRGRERGEGGHEGPGRCLPTEEAECSRWQVWQVAAN
jgi:hypothetical protein